MLGLGLLLDGQAAGGAAAWSPADLAERLLVWWKADAGVTEDEIGVTSWADQSGNGRTLLQATDLRKPTLSPGALNGLPSILFDGLDDALETVSGASYPQPVGFWILGKTVNAAGLERIFGVTNGNQVVRNFSNAWACYLGTELVGPTIASDTWYTFGAMLDGASSELQLNEGTPSTGNVGAADSGNILTLGDDGFSSFPMNGEVVELLMVDAPTATDKTNILAYLKTRGGHY
jgi:hypothetical protein